MGGHQAGHHEVDHSRALMEPIDDFIASEVPPDVDEFVSVSDTVYHARETTSPACKPLSTSEFTPSVIHIAIGMLMKEDHFTTCTKEVPLLVDWMAVLGTMRTSFFLSMMILTVTVMLS